MGKIEMTNTVEGPGTTASDVWFLRGRWGGPISFVGYFSVAQPVRVNQRFLWRHLEMASCFSKHGASIAIEIELDERGRWERPRMTAWWRSSRHQAVNGCVRVLCSLQSAAGAAGWRVLSRTRPHFRTRHALYKHLSNTRTHTHALTRTHSHTQARECAVGRELGAQTSPKAVTNFRDRVPDNFRKSKQEVKTKASSRIPSAWSSG
jgi:hypothetical protein